MVTSYIKLQIYFILSIVIAYFSFLAVWFNVDDSSLKVQSEKEFRKLIQIRNQVRDNLLSISERQSLNDNKLKIIRYVSNEWLNTLVTEIKSKRQFQRERIKALGTLIPNSSGVYIAKNKRIYLRLGRHFEKQFGKNWSRDFFSALRHGGRYFSSFMTKFYGRPETLEVFKANADKYQLLNIRGNYYYCYYTQIKDFEVLILIDIAKTNSEITLNIYLDTLIESDERLQRYSRDSFIWAGQEIDLSEKTKYGLRFIPHRSGWLDFLLSKWLIHILFILLLVFLLGLGGYQLLSLRLEFRVLVFIASCFILISVIHRTQYNDLKLVKSKLRDHHQRELTSKLCRDLYKNYKLQLLQLIRKLERSENLELKLPFDAISISTNRLDRTKFVDNIGDQVLLKILAEIMNRYNLIRKGLDPDNISFDDERKNRLSINLPTSTGLIVPRLMFLALERIKQIKPGNNAQRYLRFHLRGQELILILPGAELFSNDVIHVVCARHDDFIKYVASKTDWKNKKVALVNHANMNTIFQTFKPGWTKSKTEKVLLNRHLPPILREESDIQWFDLNWDQVILLVKIPKFSVNNDIRMEAIISILCLLLGFISIFLLRNGLFDWLTHSNNIINAYRLRRQIISLNRDWFRNEGHALNSMVEVFIKMIDSKSRQELKMSPALSELMLLEQGSIYSLSVIEVVFSGLNKHDSVHVLEVIEDELKRFNGIQLDTGAQRIKLCFPLEIDTNAIQNALETGLAICDSLTKIETCVFVSILRTGLFELDFTTDESIEYPIVKMKEVEVQKRPKQKITNQLIIDETSYKSLMELYDLEHLTENYYHFDKGNLEGKLI